MIDPEIEKLLILQDVDIDYIQVSKELDQIPVQRHRVKVRIEEQEVAVEEARKQLMELEVRRKDIENEVSHLEDTVNRYKNQQLQVKKNEEYQALTSEIDRVTNRIGELEECEIGLMLQIDEETDRFNSQKAEIQKEITRLKKEVTQLDEKEVNLKERKAVLVARVEAARQDCSALFLQAYDQAKRNLRNRPLFVAPIENGLCKRSNLRVSNELVAEAKVHGTPHFDTETGCVVYAG